ncbi:MAG TPA: V-type ATP synthase subunit D [Thermodesulfobacteriota bacterium]|nr:V-type ATP synthase subunit D [Thermodesulfobacteriota bacterium]
MEKLAPTRQQLLVLREQLGAVRKGLDLLKSKREALMKEFFDIVEESVSMRDDLTGLLSRSFRDLERSRAVSGPALESFAHAAKRKVTLDIKVKNVWGVKVPEIEETTLTRSVEARDVSPVGERADVMDVASGFEKAADLIVRIASKEVMLSRVGEMIKSDSRKINAITEMMLPAMGRRIKYIERVLEEREREEVFRLKRYKSMRHVI